MFFAMKTQRHEEIDNRGLRGFTPILFLPALAFWAIPFLEASFRERPGLIRRVIFEPGLGSWRKRCFISREKGQNA